MAHPSEVRKGFIVGDDPSVYITGRGACAPTVSVAFNLLIDLRIFPHKLESDFIDLLLLGSQLLHPHMRWGHCPPLGCATEVVSSAEMLSTCPSEVSAMKHSREG